MANPLTNSSQIICPHLGTFTPASSAKLTIGDQPVLLANEWSGWPVAGCAPKSSSETPCVHVASMTNGEAAKLSVGGVGVLLDSGGGETDGVPPIPVTLTAGQAKVQAV